MINQVVLMGRLTKDPELRTTGTGKQVCNFTLAVDDGYGDSKRADFISCMAWNKTAEFISRYFKKGQKIAVAGRLHTRIWDGKDGKKNYATEVVAFEADFCETKNTQQQEPSATQPQKISATQTQPVADTLSSVLDDDLPF